MTTNITNLRKAGRLDEAYKLAEQNLTTNPTDIWNVRNMAWVLYDYAKQKANVSTKEQFLRCINKIIELDAPAEEDVLYQSVGFMVKTMASAMIRAQQTDNAFFDALFSCLKQLKIKKQTPAYSSIMKTFLHTKTWWHSFPQFCNWWGWDSFMPDDYKPTTTENGQSIIPLAERVYMAYGKCMLDMGTQADSETTIKLFDKWSNEHKNYIYLPFYEAKLMFKIGQKDEFFRLMKQFALRKSGEFWVWDLLGDYFDDDNIRLKFYAKALICPAKQEMTVKVREKTALLLNKLGYTAEAQTELRIVAKIRERNHWHIDKALAQMLSDSKNAPANNNTWFEQLSNGVEELVFGKKLSSNNQQKEKKKFSGKITIAKGGYGFVQHESQTIFVAQTLIQGKTIANNDIVQGECVAAVDKKKNKESLKAINIKKA
ncbi:MAG: DUF7017 domain-containing protein [Paludibacteraceae bacterium]